MKILFSTNTVHGAFTQELILYSGQRRSLHFLLSTVCPGKCLASVTWLNYYQEKCTLKAANTKTTEMRRGQERNVSKNIEALIVLIFALFLIL